MAGPDPLRLLLLWRLPQLRLPGPGEEGRRRRRLISPRSRLSRASASTARPVPRPSGWRGSCGFTAVHHEQRGGACREAAEGRDSLSPCAAVIALCRSQDPIAAWSCVSLVHVGDSSARTLLWPPRPGKARGSQGKQGGVKARES